jgi:hypothetical protein
MRLGGEHSGMFRMNTFKGCVVENSTQPYRVLAGNQEPMQKSQASWDKNDDGDPFCKVFKHLPEFIVVLAPGERKETPNRSGGAINADQYQYASRHLYFSSLVARKRLLHCSKVQDASIQVSVLWVFSQVFCKNIKSLTVVRADGGADTEGCINGKFGSFPSTFNASGHPVGFGRANEQSTFHSNNETKAVEFVRVAALVFYAGEMQIISGSGASNAAIWPLSQRQHGRRNHHNSTHIDLPLSIRGILRVIPQQLNPIEGLALCRAATEEA